MADETHLAELKQLARKKQQKIRKQLALNNAIVGAKLCTYADEITLLIPNRKIKIALFMPFGSEIDVIPLANKLIQLGHVTCMPVVVQKNAPLIFRHWQPRCGLTKDIFNMDVPDDANEVMQPDIILVPLLGFDEAGWRLGYGGGFYDRTLMLHNEAISIGVGFDKQKMDFVPKGLHDKPVGYILTETNLKKI